MKRFTTKDYINDIMKFGTCYIGNADIMGWDYIHKAIRKIEKYAKENCLPIWFYHNEKENSWYANI